MCAAASKLNWSRLDTKQGRDARMSDARYECLSPRPGVCLPATGVAEAAKLAVVPIAMIFAACERHGSVDASFGASGECG